MRKTTKKKDDDDCGLFTEEELKKLILMSCDCEGGATEKQSNVFLQKCNELKVCATYLELILSGQMKVARYDDNLGVMFRMHDAPPGTPPMVVEGIPAFRHKHDQGDRN